MERLKKEENFVEQIDLSVIQKGTGAYYLVRGTSSKDIKDEYGRLKSEFVAKQSSHIRDYSTNLLGKTLPTDLLEQLKCEWYFFLKLDDFNVMTSTTDDNQIITSRVLHTPIQQPVENYWHCSIRWFLEGKDSEELTKSKSRMVWEHARSRIINLAIFEEPFFEEIPEELYLL